ncbi:hypothetical protein [Serratia fonticola]|uniref:hypothetical protein n=1 Tax=Serratia fonticola TaxID=47917 RepID=UPI001378E612|nr:hypothetical protein [Serratia fonticola]NCG50734.1 hypothetical protein [Serratia fonticola]
MALKNLGVPVKVNLVDDRFDIKNIEFLDHAIDREEIDKMKKYVELGLCDELFFNDIDSGFFQSPPKIIRARETAIRVLETIKLVGFSPYDKLYKLIKAAKTSPSQFDVIHVFWNSIYIVDDTDINNLKYDEKKIDSAIQDVRDGIFDHIFYWDYRAFTNMNEQKQAVASMSTFIDDFHRTVSQTQQPSKDDYLFNNSNQLVELYQAYIKPHL